MLKRTQLYFPDSMLDEIKQHAKKRRRSMACVIRSAVEDFLVKNNVSDWDQDPLWQMIGKGEGSEGDLSIHHDRYLYNQN